MNGRVPNDADNTGLKLTYLKGTELFQDFAPEQLESFHHTIRMTSCAAGHVFYQPGQTGETMFLLKAGATQLYRLSPDGRKFVFAEVPAGSMFGEMTCIGQAMYDCFAEATADSVICTLTRADVQRLILAYPRFAVRLIEALGQRMVEAERQLEDFAFKAVVPRLAALLQREAREGCVTGLSHQEIGERLGVYRETATYALNELKAAGIIEIGRRRIRILAVPPRRRVGVRGWRRPTIATKPPAASLRPATRPCGRRPSDPCRSKTSSASWRSTPAITICRSISQARNSAAVRTAPVCWCPGRRCGRRCWSDGRRCRPRPT